MDVIVADGVERQYGARRALDGVSFRIARGEIVGLLGPNGAGKSTLMKVLTGYLAPSGGSTVVCGFDTFTDPIGAQQQLGYLPESAPMWPEMTVRALLAFVAEVRALDGAERARRIDQVADQVGVTDRLDQPIGTLSKGYRQRVGLAQALVHEPKLLILDEPTAGLDPNQIVEMRALIRQLGRDRTVLWSTHILSEVQAACDRVLILHHGKLVADGPVASVCAPTGQRLTVALGPAKVRLSADQVRDGLAGIAGVARVVVGAPGTDTLRVVVDADQDVRAELFRWAVAHGQVLVELSAERADLEDVFRRLTVER